MITVEYVISVDECGDVESDLIRLRGDRSGRVDWELMIDRLVQINSDAVKEGEVVIEVGEVDIAGDDQCADRVGGQGGKMQIEGRRRMTDDEECGAVPAESRRNPYTEWQCGSSVAAVACWFRK